MKITKEECIEAVLTEPLNDGLWNVSNNKTCQVCAVGSILRQLGINNCKSIADVVNNEALHESVHDSLAIEGHLDNGYYLHALSCYFEDTIHRRFPKDSSRNFGMAARWTLVHFIEAFFPNELEINI